MPPTDTCKESRALRVELCCATKSNRAKKLFNFLIIKIKSTKYHTFKCTWKFMYFHIFLMSLKKKMLTARFLFRTFKLFTLISFPQLFRYIQQKFQKKNPIKGASTSKSCSKTVLCFVIGKTFILSVSPWMTVKNFSFQIFFIWYTYLVPT